MSARIQVSLRWLAMLPAALFGSYIAQLVFFRIFAIPLVATLGADPSQSWFVNGRWLAKILASPFIGAAFVLLAVAIAPSHKRLVGSGALGVVLAWSGYLSLAALVTESPGFLMTLGPAGLLGGMLAFFYSRRRIERASAV